MRARPSKGVVTAAAPGGGSRSAVGKEWGRQHTGRLRSQVMLLRQEVDEGVASPVSLPLTARKSARTSVPVRFSHNRNGRLSTQPGCAFQKFGLAVPQRGNLVMKAKKANRP